jgi:hypothetical protein
MQFVRDPGDGRLGEDSDMSSPTNGLDIAGPNYVFDPMQWLAKTPGDLPDGGDSGV